MTSNAGHGRAESGGWDVVGLATACGQLAWVADALFEVEGRWAAAMSEAAAVEHLATHSRFHGWHGDLWRALRPDSPALAEVGPVAAPSGWAEAIAAVDALVASAGSEEADLDAPRLAVLYRGLVVRAFVLVDDLGRRSVGPGGGAVARVVDLVRTDHRRDLEGGQRLLMRALGDPSTVDRVAQVTKALDQAFQK